MSEPKPNQLGFKTTDEVLTSVYNQVKISENNPERDTVKMVELRSKIYVRDRGICWICNEFVEMNDYHLGHLVDHCVGGWEDYDNLAVMHATCNLAKPHHTTLEDAMRWKLTLGLPIKRLIKHKTPMIIPTNQPTILSELTITPQSEISQTSIITDVKQKRKQKRVNEVPKKSFWNYLTDYFHKDNGIQEPIINRQIPKDQSMTMKQKGKYDEQCTKIKPCTICWVQGYPQGGAMWRVLPPPYRKEDGFIMRRTPLGAKEPKGERGVQNSIQVINGELKETVNIDLGIINFTIILNKDKPPIVKFATTDKANTGKHTIGMGINQIPYKEWLDAKNRGEKRKDFIDNYYNK